MSLSTTNSTPDRIPLAAVENVLCDVGELFDGDGTSLLATFVDGRIEEGPLRAALEAVQQRHPKLRARILNVSDGHRSWRIEDPPPPIPLEFHDCDDELPPWQHEARRWMCESFELTDCPLARVKVTRSQSRPVSRLAYVAHHALVDGASLRCVIEDLFRYYAEIVEHGTLEPVRSLPLVTSVHPVRAGTAWSRIAILSRLIRQRIETRRAAWTKLPPAEVNAGDPEWTVHEFPVRQSLAIVQACRREESSLNSVLLSAAARALRTTLAQPEVRFKCRTAFDMRSYLRSPAGPVNKYDLGCYVNGFDKIYKVTAADTFWQLARRAEQEFSRFVAGGGPSLLYGMLRFARRIKSIPPRINRPTLQVSAGGVSTMRDNYGGLRVTRMLAGAKHDHIGPQVAISGYVLHRRLLVMMEAVDVPSTFRDCVWQHTLSELQRAGDR